MGYKDFEGLDLGANTHNSSITLQADGESINLPAASFVRDANLTRDGMDLILDGPDGSVTIEGYFAAEHSPNLIAPDGSSLTPELVNSFARSAPEFAQGPALNDESPVGAVQEVSGGATVTHMDGTVETITIGTPIFQGDIIQTDAEGAVNVVFVDETSFAVSEDARLAIDEYVFDSSTQSGETNFSVLKGVFVFTSGLIGRDDPDDVHIDTPVGSIGIRGTIIAGNVNTGEITVVEGAIVLRDLAGNEVTLANQFETAQFNSEGGISHLGQLSAADVSGKFSVISQVSPTLFSSINDAAAEQTPGEQTVQPDADGTVDQNNDAQVDGSVETAPETTPEATETAPVGDGAQVVPPPVSAPLQVVSTLGTNTGFGTNTSGLAPTTNITPPLTPPSTGTHAATTTIANAGAGAGTNDPLPPPPNNLSDPVDPNVIGGGGPTIVGIAPRFLGQAPQEYFTGVANTTWTYNFTKDFSNAGGGALTFSLDPGSIALLNDLQNTGGIDILNGYNFNPANGELYLSFQPTMIGVAVNSAFDFNFTVIATNANGSVSHTYNFDAYNPLITNASNVYTTNGQVLYGSVGNDTIDLDGGVQNDTVFLGNGDDTLYITDASNNFINLGNGLNQVDIGIAGSNANNTVIGGFDVDQFLVSNARNKLLGMGGDDEFIINNSSLPQLLAAGTNTLLDGGTSAFRAGDAIATALNAYNGSDATALRNAIIPKVTGFGDAGRGDSVMFDSTLTGINLSGLDPDYLKGIERLDFENGGTNTITLTYENVFNMTDGKKTLIINLDGTDSLTFVTGGHSFTKVADNLMIDDAEGNTAIAGPTGDIAYDVYTDGNITLVISDQGNVTGLPP